MRLSWMIALLLLLAPATQGGELVAKPAAESLSGDPVVLPDDLTDDTTLLIIGFSRASRKQTGAWSQQLQKMCRTRPRLGCFDVAVIAGVPSLLRGFVAGRIRDDIPAQRHARYLLVRDHAAKWKALAGFDKQYEDDAWLVLLGRDGDLLWHAHGPWSDRLRQQLMAAMKQP